MSTPHAPFADAFDALALNAARAGAADGSGFYLLDDGGGRFVVDRTFGIVSLANEAILETERNSVHAARLRVIEPSGACYEIELRLRLTGPVPKMVGAEDIDFPTPAAQATPAPAPSAWSAYAAAAAKGAPPPINNEARFGAAFARPLPPAAPGPYRLHLFTPLPRPAEKTATWSL